MELEVPVVEADPGRRGGGFPCPNCDIQVVHKVAQLLLPGLATACVDSTFRNPSSVAVELRKEMVDYITANTRSPLMMEQDPIDDPDPTEMVASFLDDFASTKRNVLSHVVSLSGSSWLSDTRDDRIDDLVQEMETTRFWPLDRREAVARILLMNLETRFHCRDNLETPEMLAEHVAKRCTFRPVRCQNQGCRAVVSARRAEEHDSLCLFKILPCEQHCELSVTRREMDRHCITTCPMKLTNCPFYQVGCESAFPSCNLESHCSQFLRSHLQKLLLNYHKEIKEERLLLLEKCDSDGMLLKALDVRSLTKALGELEKKINADDDSSSYTGDKNAAHPHKEAMHAQDDGHLRLSMMESGRSAGRGVYVVP